MKLFPKQTAMKVVIHCKKKGAVAPKTASALWQGFMLCMESLPYFYEKSVEPMAWIADDLRFATQLSNVYGNAIRAKLATAQTTRSVADSFSSFVTQNLQSICSLYHKHPRFFHKSSESVSIVNPWIPAIYATPGAKKAVFVSAGCGTPKEKSRTFLQRTALGV